MVAVSATMWMVMGVTMRGAAASALRASGDRRRLVHTEPGGRDAGADHVCIQVLTDDLMSPSRDEWRRLAPALLG